jgi:hypothetical protein
MDTDYALGLGVFVFLVGLIIIGIGYLIYNTWKSNNRNDIQYNKI